MVKDISDTGHWQCDYNEWAKQLQGEFENKKKELISHTESYFQSSQPKPDEARESELVKQLYEACEDAKYFLGTFGTPVPSKEQCELYKTLSEAISKYEEAKK